MHKSRRLKITDINPHLTCVLCSGYLIDATTIIECLHSFCRTCIVKYLESNKYCPICDVQVHKTKPLLNIRSDQTLQDIVYKLVPGLFQNEMCRRRDFYAKHPEHKPPSAEENGEVTQFSHIYTADESISLSLEYYSNKSCENDNNSTVDTKLQQQHPSRRYLRCPAAVSVSHLQKLIRAKYGLSNEHRVDILYLNDKLSDDFTLMDIAYIYLWRRKGPLHLTYRIFEVAKRIKLSETSSEKDEIKIEKQDNDDETNVKNEWKEVQLQISENGIMSVTNIEAKLETVAANVIEVKNEMNVVKTEVSDIPTEKLDTKIEETVTEKPVLEKPAPEKPLTEVKKLEENTIENEVKLGKHKLQDTCDSETNAKVIKLDTSVKNLSSVKNVQQLSRNHPLKIHSQSVSKNHVTSPPPVTNANPVVKVLQTQPKTNQNAHVQYLSKTLNNNNNNHVSKTAIAALAPVQKDQQSVTAPVSVQNSLPAVQITPNLISPQTTTTYSAKTTETTSTVSSATSTLTSTTTTTLTPSTTVKLETPPVVSDEKTSCTTSIVMPNIPKYTQAGQSSDNTITTSAKPLTDSIQKIPVSTSSSCPPIVSNNCIQSSRVSINQKKSSIGYKTLRDPPKAWNPQISRQNITKTNTFPTNNGASTSELNKIDNRTTPVKPAKFFKMRNNMPRYLGNPASGVKPMYQVRDDKSSPDAKNTLEVKKPSVPENKVSNNNNNNKDDVKPKPEVAVDKIKMEVKKPSIIKIDPKTLRPIVDKPQEVPSCSEIAPEMKINQSTVPIFNPLRTQKSSTSPKIDRRSPKSSNVYLDPPKSPMDRNSPKIKALNSPTSKKDKLNINFTPSNPFIPNLTSPNLAPNQFLYPNFASYDPRVMNNLSAYHPFSMYFSQPRLNYPGLTSQNLPLSSNLIPNLNLESNKNLRKNFDIPSMMQLSPTLEMKKSATTVKTSCNEKTNLSIDKNFEIKSGTKSSPNRNLKTEKVTLQNTNQKLDIKNSFKEDRLKATPDKETKTNRETENKVKEENKKAEAALTEEKKKDCSEKQAAKEIVKSEVKKDKSSDEIKEDKSKQAVQKEKVEEKTKEITKTK